MWKTLDLGNFCLLREHKFSLKLAWNVACNMHSFKECVECSIFTNWIYKYVILFDKLCFYSKMLLKDCNILKTSYLKLFCLKPYCWCPFFKICYIFNKLLTHTWIYSTIVGPLLHKEKKVNLCFCFCQGGTSYVTKHKIHKVNHTVSRHWNRKAEFSSLTLKLFPFQGETEGESVFQCCWTQTGIKQEEEEEGRNSDEGKQEELHFEFPRKMQTEPKGGKQRKPEDLCFSEEADIWCPNENLNRSAVLQKPKLFKPFLASVVWALFER